MEEVGELAHAVGEPGRGPRVAAVPVDGDGGTRESQPGGALRRRLGAEAARRDHDEVGCLRDHLVPRHRVGGPSRAAEHVRAARAVDHLRQPVAGAERRVDPLGEEHPATRQALHRARRELDRRPHLRHDRLPALGPAEPRREDANGPGDLVKRPRIEREHLRTDRARRRELTARDGADRAEILRHDQIGRERLDQIGVDGVERGAVRERVAHRLARSRGSSAPPGRSSRRSTTGLPTTSGGQRNSAETPTRSSIDPSCAITSVALGKSEQMRIPASTLASASPVASCARSRAGSASGTSSAATRRSAAEVPAAARAPVHGLRTAGTVGSSPPRRAARAPRARSGARAHV